MDHSAGFPTRSNHEEQLLLLQQELEAANQKFTTLFTGNPQPMLVYNIETLRFLDVNEAALSLYGYSRDEFLSMNIKDIRPADEIPRLLSYIASPGNRPGTDVLWKHFKKNGELMFVKVASHEILFEGIQARHVMISDVTEIKLTQLALAESEAWVRSILDNMLEGCQILGFDLTYKYLNDTALKHSHQKRSHLLGKKITEVWPGIEKTKLYKFLVQCLDKREHYQFDNQFTYNDGTKGWFRLSIQPVPEGVFILSIDISKRKEIEKSLKQSELKFRNLFHQHAAVKLLIDAETGNITDANQAAADFYGWSREELMSMNISDINTLSVPKLKEAVQNVIQKKKNHFSFTHRTKSGALKHVEVASSMIMAGCRQQLHSIIQDVTDKKLAEEQEKKLIAELTQAKLKAEESDRLKTAFLANMSHEIRTPMNGILGFIQLLQEPELSGEEREEYNRLMQISSRRLMDTIHDIMDISKIESGTVVITETPVDVNEILVDTVNFFTPEASSRQLSLSVSSLLPHKGRRVITDRYKVESILINLVKNALKFTTAGSVTIGVTLTGNLLEMAVSDTGPGIPADMTDRIFSRFTQVDSSLQRSHEGSGLGLAISRAYAELLGGTLTVQSAVGEGSVFKLVLPV